MICHKHRVKVGRFLPQVAEANQIKSHLEQLWKTSVFGAFFQYIFWVFNFECIDWIIQEEVLLKKIEYCWAFSFIASYLTFAQHKALLHKPCNTFKAQILHRMHQNYYTNICVVQNQSNCVHLFYLKEKCVSCSLLSLPWKLQRHSKLSTTHGGKRKLQERERLRDPVHV